MKKFIWLFLLLLSCDPSTQKQTICGTALDKWHECGVQCNTIYYYIDIQADGVSNSEKIVQVDQQTYGKTQIGEKIFIKLI